MNTAPDIIKALDALRSQYVPAWFPQDGNKPQQMAFETEAQVVFYGGKAGGGKTELLIGKALMHGRNVLFLRRTFPQFERIIQRFKEIVGPDRVTGGKMVKPDTGSRGITAEWIRLGHIEHDKDVEQYQGGERDILVFDELTHFTRRMFTMLMTWNRTTRRDKDGKPIKTQVLAAGNPPVSTEGLWVVDMFGPWLDPKNEHYPTPSGKILWRYEVDNRVYWKEGGRKVRKHPKTGEPLSRPVYPISFTFIAAGFEDNPELANDPEYLARLDMLPPELRSALRDGDFQNSLMDQPFQIVPIKPLRESMDRHKAGTTEGPQTVVGVDVARGGADNTTIAPWHGHRCDRVDAYPGISTMDGDSVVARIMETIDRREVPIAIDVIGVGASVYDTAIKVFPFVYPYSAAGASISADASGQFEFLNKNAEDWWMFREAVMAGEVDVPDDADLFRQLTGRNWKISATGKIQIEAKEDYRKRTGESPDKADALIIGFSQSRVMSGGSIKWG